MFTLAPRSSNSATTAELPATAAAWMAAVPLLLTLSGDAPASSSALQVSTLPELAPQRIGAHDESFGAAPTASIASADGRATGAFTAAAGALTAPSSARTAPAEPAMLARW